MTKKEIAVRFLEVASSGNVREVYDQYVHPDFIHHNAYFKGDRETLLIGMEENQKQFPDKTYETLRTIEEGDLVAVHGKVVLSPDMIYSLIHIFRFKDGKIIEEWEAGQQLLDDSPNENGIF